MPSDTKPQIDWDSLTFSFTQTDRMYIAKCEIGGEWEKGVMKNYEDLVISPAAGVLNYGQGLFEGCLLYTSPSPRDATLSRMPSSA